MLVMSLIYVKCVALYDPLINSTQLFMAYSMWDTVLEARAEVANWQPKGLCHLHSCFVWLAKG